MKASFHNSTVPLLAACAVAMHLVPAPTDAADVRSWVVNKHQQFVQSNSGTPAFRDPGTPYQFEAAANSDVTNVITALSVRLPGGSTVPGSPYPTNDDFGLGFSVSDQFATEPLLEAGYPTGKYVLTITTVNDGVKTVTNNLPASVYPSTPHVSNYDAAQNLDPATDFLLTWDAFIGGTGNDFILLRVKDSGSGQSIFESPGFGQSGGLNGLSNSIVIPQNTLTVNPAYSAELWFIKVINLDTNSYPGARGLTIFWKRTFFDLQTSTTGAADVLSYNVSKKQDYLQTGAGTPLLQSNNAYSFSSAVNTPVATNTLLSATVRLVSGDSRSLTNVNSDGNDFGESFATQSALDAVYGSGNYTLSINTLNDGLHTGLVLNLSGDAYPNPPHVINLSEAQRINPNADFVLAWDPFVGGTANDFIGVKIKGNTGTVFQTPFPGEAGALAGTVTSVVIPAGTMTAGQSYTAQLQFAKLVNRDTGSYPGALGLSAYISRTTFTVSAAACFFPVATDSAIVEVAGGVAFDGTNYLVVMQSGAGIFDGFSGRYDLEAQMFSPAAAVAGPKLSLGFTYSWPSVAFDGNNYLVVGEGSNSIHGQFVSRAGQPVGSSFLINQGTGIEDPEAVLFAGTNYLVIWSDARRAGSGPGDSDIYGRRVSTAGIPIGGEFKISGVAGDGAAAAFDGTNVLVIWRDDLNDTDIYGRLIGPSGAFVTSEFVIDANSAPSDNPSAVTFDGTKYLVLFNDEVGGPGTGAWDIFGRFVTTAGNVLTNRITITTATGPQRLPSLAFDGSNYLVSWNDELGTTNSNLKYEFFDTTGQSMSSEFTVFSGQGTNVPILGGVLFDGKRYAAIATLGTLNTNLQFTSGDVYGAFVDPFPGGTFPIAITSGSEWGTSAAFDGTNYLVAIKGDAADPNNITAQMISSTGTLIGSRIAVGRTGGVPLVAFDGVNYLLVWQDDASAPDDDIYGARISRSGTPVGGPFVISAAAGYQAFDSINHLAFDGSNFLVVWRDDRNGPDNSDVFGQLISPAGTLVAAEILISTDPESQRVPSVAFDGINYFVVWQSKQPDPPEAWDTYGRFISKAGVPGSSFLISQSPSARYNPTSVAFDGTNYLVVWNRDVGPGFPNPTAWDIYARFVSQAGTFVGNEFPITTTAGDQVFPGVVFDGNNYVVGWIDTGASRGVGRFFDRAGVPVGPESSLFGCQGTRWPLTSIVFGGPQPLALTTLAVLPELFLGGNPNGDVYGTFLSAFGPPTPPGILVQPTSQTISQGSPIGFSVSANGTPPLFYQWRLNGVNIADATNAAYTIVSAQIADGGSYTVVIANAAGAVVSQAAVLSISGIPTGPPAADDFADRYSLSGGSGAVAVNNVGATKEPGEPNHAGKSGGKSVWYNWQAPTNGIATFRTSGSGFDTLLAVYRGSNVTNLVPVASDEDRGGFLTSEVRFNAQAGVGYAIAIDGFGGAAGDFVLEWELEPTLETLPVIFTQPQNRTVFAGTSVTFTVAAGGQGLTYQWYFNGTAIAGATSATLNRSNPGDVDVGSYTVRVANNQNRAVESSPAFLEIGPTPGARSQDKLQDLIEASVPAGPSPQSVSARQRPHDFPVVVAGALGTQILNNFGATTEAGEPSHAGVIGGASRWFILHAQTDGVMVVDTIGSDIDTVLAVYTGTDLLDLAPIASDDNGAPDGVRSRVRFAAVAGTDYLIAVDGVNGVQGTIQLNWQQPVLRLNTRAGGGAAFTNGNFRLLFDGVAGQSIIIEASTNLLQWLPVYTTAGQGGPVEFLDTTAPGHRRRFYRALLGP